MLRLTIELCSTLCLAETGWSDFSSNDADGCCDCEAVTVAVIMTTRTWDDQLMTIDSCDIKMGSEWPSGFKR